MPPAFEIAKPEQPTLQSFCPQAVLDSVQGLACLVSPQLTIAAFSRSWNETMARGGRNELNATQLLNQSFLKLLADDEQQIAWRKLFEALSRGNLDAHAQVVDFGTAEGSRPFHLEISVHPLWGDGEFLGYLVQGTDATAAHVNRLAVLDRERKLKETKQETAQQREQFKIVINRLNDRQKEQSAMAIQLARGFAANPKEFPTEFCRIMQRQAGSMFCTLFTFNDETEKLALTAHNNAPDFYELTRKSGYIELSLGEGPCGITGAAKSPRGFYKLRTLEEYAPWVHLAEENGFNSIWAFPLLENGNLLAVVQCYFAAPEQKLSGEEQGALAWLCELSAPLIRAAEAFRNATHPVIQIVEETPQPPTELDLIADAEPEEETQPSDHDVPAPEIAASDAPPEHEESEGAYRFIAGGLAEEFSNLLTGVLGHSSLAVAEMGESHVAMSDLRAIERAARNAAKLTKRLSALSGEARKSQTPIELGEFLRRYSDHYQYQTVDSGPVSLALPVDPCHVYADAASLEVVLDGMLEHAFACMQAGTTFEWKLHLVDQSAQLELRYYGSAVLPRGWNDEEPTAPSRHRHYELFVSRESARALGGNLDVETIDGETTICLALPRANILDESC